MPNESLEPSAERLPRDSATYRVLFVRLDGGVRVAHAGLESRSAAVRVATAAIENRVLRSRVAEIVLQRGTPASRVAFDAARVIPGIRGGWSDTAWDTISRWRPGEDEAIRSALSSASPPAPSGAPAASVTTADHPDVSPRCEALRDSAARHSYERWRWKVWGCVALAVTAWFVTLAYLSR
ncbi:MAG: hypothetical protein HRF50_05260 [Phycisphaerae bacterium]|jgi:hypothetical protein